MEMIKAVKIDVVNKTVSIISVEKDNSQHLRDHVGGWITLAMTLPSGDIMYVDDEGLLKNPENFQVFNPQPAYEVHKDWAPARLPQEF